jgi:hypothetical protein
MDADIVLPDAALRATAQPCPWLLPPLTLPGLSPDLVGALLVPAILFP